MTPASPSQASPPVAITGLGCVTSIGNTVAAFRESLFTGRTGIAQFDPIFPESLSEVPNLRFRTWARVSGFKPAEHLSSGVISMTGLGAQFGIVEPIEGASTHLQVPVLDRGIDAIPALFNKASEKR